MSRKKGLLEHIQVSSADLQRACGKLPTPRQLGRRLPGRAQTIAATPPIELVGLTICSTVVMSTLKYRYSPAFALDVHFGRSASCGCTGGISSFNQTVEVLAPARCSTFVLLRFLQKGLAFVGKASIAVA